MTGVNEVLARARQLDGRGMVRRLPGGEPARVCSEGWVAWREAGCSPRDGRSRAHETAGRSRWRSLSRPAGRCSFGCLRGSRPDRPAGGGTGRQPRKRDGLRGLVGRANQTDLPVDTRRARGVNGGPAAARSNDGAYGPGHQVRHAPTENRPRAPVLYRTDQSGPHPAANPTRRCRPAHPSDRPLQVPLRATCGPPADTAAEHHDHRPGLTGVS